MTATGLYVFGDGLPAIALPALGASVCAAEMVSTALSKAKVLLQSCLSTEQHRR